jgi:hypothetical protein
MFSVSIWHVEVILMLHFYVICILIESFIFLQCKTKDNNESKNSLLGYGVLNLLNSYVRKMY